jgi:DivIVA domain-containing protein
MLKKKLTSLEILEKKFTADVKGYAAYEVDAFLDLILQDFKDIESFIKDELPRFVSLEHQLIGLKRRVQDLEIENLDLKDKVSVINKNDTIEINQSNFHLIKKIGLLEKELYKLGIDPNKLK